MVAKASTLGWALLALLAVNAAFVAAEHAPSEPGNKVDTYFWNRRGSAAAPHARSVTLGRAPSSPPR